MDEVSEIGEDVISADPKVVSTRRLEDSAPDSTVTANAGLFEVLGPLPRAS